MPNDLQVFIDELHDQIIHISTREPTAEYTVEEYSDVVVDLLIKLSADGVRGDARKQEKVIATFVDDMGIYLVTGSVFEAKTKEEHIKMEIFKDYHKMFPENEADEAARYIAACICEYYRAAQLTLDVFPDPDQTDIREVEALEGFKAFIETLRYMEGVKTVKELNEAQNRGIKDLREYMALDDFNENKNYGVTYAAKDVSDFTDRL